jgi:hypothetical protein
MSTNEEGFKFTPRPLPKKVGRKGKYEKTIQKFIESDKDAVVIDLEKTKVQSAYQSFYKTIKDKYSDALSVHKIGNEIYLSKNEG